MERLVQSALQRILGFDRYLYWFSRVKIRSLRWDRNERDVLEFIRRIPEDGVALDLGANIGIMTALMAERVRRGHVHAYEPIPENFQALTRIVRRMKLDNVVLHQVALGSEAGELRMVMPEQEHVRMQGLSHAVDPDADTVEAGVQYTVPVRRLDDEAELAGLQVDAIKIDVENFEEKVFRGGAALLERCRPLVYAELWDNDVRRGCFELFGGLGYTVKVFDGATLVPFDPDRHTQHNFFLCPE